MLVALATPARAVDTDDQLIERVRRAVIRHKLVDNIDCIDYVITRNASPRVDEVDLREHHDARCGGDPETGPRLLSVMVDRRTHEMATDAYDPADGGLKMLK